MSYHVTYDDAVGTRRWLEFGSRAEAESAFDLLAGRHGNTGAMLAEFHGFKFRVLLSYGSIAPQPFIDEGDYDE